MNNIMLFCILKQFIIKVFRPEIIKKANYGLVKGTNNAIKK